MKTFLWPRSTCAGVAFTFVVLTLGGCEQPRADKPTPEAAKRFLQLRGYQFDPQSFQRAVTANDVSAVDGFIAAGILAATHDQLDVVKVLLRGGANLNAKDMGGYTALLRALEKKNDAIAEL